MTRHHTIATRLATRQQMLVGGAAALLSLATIASPALAAKQQVDESEFPDARLMGFDSGSALHGQGTSTTGAYLATIVLGAIALGALFKSTGRSHLD